MVKFIGQDKQGTASSALKAPDTTLQPLNQSDKSFQFAAQQYQQTGESLKSSLQFQSQIASRVSQDIQQTNATLAETRSKTIQAQGGDNGFSQAMNTLAGVGNMVVQTLDARAKREAAEAKAVREANAATMWERISKWETEAPAIAKFDPAGTVKLRSQLDDLFNSVEGADLLMEDRTALMKHAYGNVITGLVTKNVESLAKKQEEVVDANRNLRKEKAVFEASSLISGLTASSTVEEQQASIGKLREYLAAVSQSGELQPLDKAEIQVGIVTLMNKAKFSSDDTRLKAEQVMQDYASFEEEVRQARAAYPDNIEAQETMVAAAAYRYKIPTELAKRYTVTDAQERRLQQLSNEEKERDIQERRTAYSIGAAGSDEEAGFDAITFDSDAAAETLAATLGNGNAKVGRETPRFKQYEAARKALKTFKDVTQKTAEEGAQLLLDKQKLGVADAQSMIAYLKELKPSPQTDAIVQQLRIATGNNPALGALLPVIGQYQQLDAANRKLYDDKFAQAQEALLDARQGIVGAIDEVYRVKQQNVENAITELAKYGFRRNGTFDPAKAKAIEDRRLKREAERSARFAEGQGGVEEPANFNQATGANYFNPLKTLYTHVNPERGDLVLPVTAAEIKRQGPGNYNEGVGWRAWANRQHNGQDYGLDEGTPIVSHMDAVVTKVEYQANGAGHYIELKYPDGTHHVQMHLYERPNLAVGQKVKAGQNIGKVGNSGLGGGPSNAHLHWEVRNADGSLSTPQEWSKQFRQRMASSGGQGRQPGTPGRGSSVTAPTRGLQGVPIKGGTLIPNGKGGASVVSGNTPVNVPKPVKADPTKSGQVLLQRTGNKDNLGLEILVATVFDKSGRVVSTYQVNSGSPSMQRAFGGPGSTVSGSNAPLEYGTYNIGSPEAAYDIPGMRSNFIPIEPKFNTDRSLLGIHFDGNRSVAPGSAGCIVFKSKAEFDKFTRELKQNQNKLLNFSSQFVDKGQQINRPTSPPLTAKTAASTFVGPNGKLWGRDTKGVPFQLPDPVGQSGGVSSQPARFSNAAPIRNLRSSNRPGDYRIDDINNHHGFKALKSNPNHAVAINSAAKELGVPGEWLAEVISVETDNTFDPKIKEYGGSGATGIIQFFPDYEGGSYKTINGKRYDLAAIGRMTLEQQVRGPMMDYIREAMRSNGMKKISTIQDLYALVWAYGPASKARRMRDMRGPSGTEVLNRLGKFSGRKYSSNATPAQTMAESYSSPRANKLTTPIDRSYHANCTSCNQMASLNMFVPHERNVLNKGMEVFNLA